MSKTLKRKEYLLANGSIEVSFSYENEMAFCVFSGLSTEENKKNAKLFEQAYNENLSKELIINT